MGEIDAEQRYSEFHLILPVHDKGGLKNILGMCSISTVLASELVNNKT